MAKCTFCGREADQSTRFVGGYEILECCTDCEEKINKETSIIDRIATANGVELDMIMAEYLESIGKTEEWKDGPWQELYECEGDKVAGAAYERWSVLHDQGEYDAKRQFIR